MISRFIEDSHRQILSLKFQISFADLSSKNLLTSVLLVNIICVSFSNIV